MNTLNGYSKSTLTDNNVLTAAGGHIPLELLKANSANQLHTARTIAISDGAVGTPTSFNGTANISIPVTSVKEAYLTWGGKNLAGSISPIDAAMDGQWSANRLSFLPVTNTTTPANSAVKVEYSTNGGSSWVDYELTDAQKTSLVTTGLSQNIYLGKLTTALVATTSSTVGSQLRVTISAFAFYFSLKKIYIYLTMNGAQDPKVKIEYSKNGSDTSYSTLGTYSVSGWSGWNSIPYACNFGGGETQTGNTRRIRMTFFFTKYATNYETKTAFYISKIAMVGETMWSNSGGNLPATGHLYSYDTDKKAIFPAKVQASEFIGSLKGNATTATSLSSWTVAGSDATKRYVWMSHNDNSGRACYDTDLTYLTSTDTLFVKNVYATHFITAGGISSLFVKGDGSLDDTEYASVASCPKGGNITYDQFTTPSTTSDGWYTIFTCADNTNSPCLVNVRAYAHSSMIFIVTKGWSTSGNISIIEYNSSSNNAYAWIKGARILSNGKVQINLYTGSNVDVQISVVSPRSVSLASTLVCDNTAYSDSTSVTIIDSKLGTNKTMFITDLKVSNNILATSFVKKDGTSSQFLKADGSVDSNSYMKVGNSSYPTAYYRTVTVNNTVYGFLAHTASSGFNVYAPTTVGTKGQFVLSNGSGAPVWSAIQCLSFSLNDNGGKDSYLLIANLSDWKTGTNCDVSLIGTIYGHRGGNQSLTDSYNIVALCTSYSSGNLYILYTSTYSNRTVLPYIVEYLGTKYLALRKRSSGDTIYFIGYAKGLSDTYTSCDSPSSTSLPSGMTIVYEPSYATHALATTKLYDGTTMQTIYHAGNLSKSTLGLGNVLNTAFYERSTTVNGTAWKMAGTANSAAFTIYAPTTAGTSGYVLTSAGTGAPGWTALSDLSVDYANSAGSVAWGNITGKPSFFSGNYNDLTNKPTIPSVGNGTITIKQAGTTKGTFTMNQSGDTTIALTDTTYSNATQSASGLMSAADKKKLDGISSGAGSYSLPLAANGTRGGIQIGYSDSGANVALQLSSEKGFVALTKTAVTSALGYTPPTSNTNYYHTRLYSSGLKISTGTGVSDMYVPTVTTSTAGVMSAADKTKLNGIAEGANKYSLPTASATQLGGIKVGTGLTISSSVLSILCTAGSGDSDRPIVVTNTSNGLYYTNTFKINYSTGKVTATGSIYAASFYENSDRNLKENIQVLSGDLLDQVYNVKEVSFDWKKTKAQAFGYIALDFENISETFIGRTDNGTLSLNYTEVLVAQIAALKQKIANLEQRINGLLCL